MRILAGVSAVRSGKTGVQLGADVARNMVLFGASQVFAVHGFRATTVDQLIEASRISRRTFYRLFDGKDAVALALYTLGTTSLIEACRRAIAQERDLLGQLERCIDVHLVNARDVGRLVFVLGGEAQRVESPLHARRIEVHDAIVAMLHVGPAARLDPLLLRALILALEAVTRNVLAEGDEGRKVSEPALARARRVAQRIASAAIAGGGSRVAPLPLAPGIVEE